VQANDEALDGNFDIGSNEESFPFDYSSTDEEEMFAHIYPSNCNYFDKFAAAHHSGHDCFQRPRTPEALCLIPLFEV
jgi:hypothetical protein